MILWVTQVFKMKRPTCSVEQRVSGYFCKCLNAQARQAWWVLCISRCRASLNPCEGTAGGKQEGPAIFGEGSDADHS